MAGKIIEKKDVPLLTRISVSGFKSIRDEQFINVSPLTILAGANSSGKSSMMQPLLLLKQTLEAPYDPGPLLLNGPNVKFTEADQLLSRFGKEKKKAFKISMTYGDRVYEMAYSKEATGGFQLDSCRRFDGGSEELITVNMGQEQVEELLPDNLGNLRSWDIIRNRCFYENVVVNTDKQAKVTLHFLFSGFLINVINGIVYLPSLRGTRERSYPVAAVGNTFSGTFDNYTASVIFHWQTSGNEKKIKDVTNDLKNLGLTSKIHARKLNDVQIELYVSRLPQAPKGDQDLVNIADVGFGVSQVLPIITALHAANPGQIVYLEQPEIHLHPRAQMALAEVLAEAAKRGVYVIAETHSKLLLLGIQTLITEGKLPASLVSLNWFERDKPGATHVTQGAIDELGRFGDWPTDFDDVTLDAEGRYLQAIDKRLAV